MDFPPGSFMRTALPGTLQEVFQKLAGVGFGILRESFGRAGTDESPPALPAFGSKIDQPVRGFDDIEVVFDHNDRVTLIPQAMQHPQQLADIVKMKPGGGFIQNIECSACGPFREFSGQFDALRFSARKRCCALT